MPQKLATFVAEFYGDSYVDESNLRPLNNLSVDFSLGFFSVENNNTRAVTPPNHQVESDDLSRWVNQFIRKANSKIESITSQIEGGDYSEESFSNLELFNKLLITLQNLDKEVLNDNDPETIIAVLESVDGGQGLKDAFLGLINYDYSF